jgi:hypothetical protein
MGTVGLVFAPLAPLVALAAAVVLWMSSIVQKYQVNLLQSLAAGQL